MSSMSPVRPAMSSVTDDSSRPRGCGKMADIGKDGAHANEMENG